MYEVILLSKAEKYYKKCDAITVKRLNECFERMETDPFTYGTVKALTGKEFKGLYRTRIGSLRIIFKVVEEADEKEVKTKLYVYIIDIAPRGDVYK